MAFIWTVSVSFVFSVPLSGSFSSPTGPPPFYRLLDVEERSFKVHCGGHIFRRPRLLDSMFMTGFFLESHVT